ncbi:hypothetical protein [Streptomyces sp. B8F3]|uniref:hypothetical protein n=1 Tax=unclassified Streptomyces TaxID=2593676 RepID=UPI00325D78C5
MAFWEPRQGETLLSRGAMEFATGRATRVSRKRWFRDTERRDIQHELPGWPEGPTYTVRSRAARNVRSSARKAGVVSHTLVVVAASALGALGSPFGEPRIRGKSEDPENEVDDFPVMWAQEGGIARTLPWQLDPARRPANYRTHLIITDVRLVVVGFPDDDTSRDERLWEADRSVIAQVEQKRFSEGQRDFVITFTDGSWCRLHSYDQSCVYGLILHIGIPSEFIPPDQLTPRQCQGIEDFLEKVAPSEGGSATYPYRVVTRLPSGNFLFEAWSEPAHPVYGTRRRRTQVFGPEGEPAKFRRDDFDWFGDGSR